MNDSICQNDPQIHQPLVVEDCQGKLVNCGSVISAQEKCITRGEPGFRIQVKMVKVTTTEHRQPFLTYTKQGYAEALEAPIFP